MRRRHDITEQGSEGLPLYPVTSTSTIQTVMLTASQIGLTFLRSMYSNKTALYLWACVVPNCDYVYVAQ